MTFYFPTSLCGVLVFDSVSRSSSAASSSFASSCYTLFHTQLAHTHNTVTHNPFHTQHCRTQLETHTHNFVTHTTLSHTRTHNFVTHSLLHTTLSHTSCSHTTFVTHSLSHTTLSHTTLSHTLFHTQLYHTQHCHTQLPHTHTQHNFLTHTQVCHTPSFTHNCGRRGACSHSPSFCVAAPRHFAWQAWHLVTLLTSTFVLRGRRGTWRHLTAFGVALGALGGHLVTSTFVLRGTQPFHIHTHNSSTWRRAHTTLPHKFVFNLSILPHLLCLSFLPRLAST